MGNFVNILRSCFFQISVFTIFIGLISTKAVAQVRQWTPPAKLEISATGTGNTTGHIATLTVTNESKQLQQLDFGNCYIPSEGKYQSYVVPGIQSVEVPPKGTITADVYGYCADINRPPVEGGNPMPDPNTWLVPVNTINPDGPPTFIVFPADVKLVERNPGQTYIDNAPVGYVNTNPDQAIIVDPDKNPEQAATFLLDAIHRIMFTFDDLQSEGSINTPFSSNLPRERESVIQQTFWVYGAALSGDNYEKEQFAEQVTRQYENSTGRPIATAPPDEKLKLDEGVNDFWNSFSLVGVEAKVISTPEKGKASADIGQTAGTDTAPSAKAAEPPTTKTESKHRSVDEIEREIARLRARQNREPRRDRKHFEDELSNLEKELKETKDYLSDEGKPLLGEVAKGAAKGAKGVADGVASDAKSDETDNETPATSAEEHEPDGCLCGDFTMKLRVKKPDGSYDRYFDVAYDADPKNDDWIASPVDATGANIGVGEEIEFEISDIDFECSCEQVAPCDNYTPHRIYSKKPKRNAKSGSFKIHTRDEMCETIKNNEDNTKVTAKPRFTQEECDEMEVKRQYGFMVNQVCQTESCGAVSCYVYIFIRL